MALHTISRFLLPTCALALTLGATLATANEGRRNILITGYWPPTNELVRSWSTNPAQNPSGWLGGNWEGRGYNIHSYFPEFPGGTSANPRGVGDLEVDYQDTAKDFDRIVAQIQPAAIITFSRANTTIGWEMEPAYQRFRLPGEAQLPGRTIPQYTQDYAGNLYPTDVPIASEPLGTVRLSTLPMQQIVTAVSAAISPTIVDPFIPAYNPLTPDTFDYGGAFLSGYMGYLGAWYQARNSTPGLSTSCYAAGHIHVGQGMAAGAAVEAAEVTLRVLTGYLDTVVIPAPGTTLLGVLALALGARRRR
jgi:hypothetical protein